MDQWKAGVIAALRKRFPERSFLEENLTLLHRGRFANALLFHYRDDASDLVVKDYSHCPKPLQLTIGRLFIAREARALARLQGIDGIVPKSCRLNPLMLAYPYIEGTPLRTLLKRRQSVPAEFFQDLERLVRQVHARDVAHLDLRNLGNILYGKDGRPYCIDFQSALSFRRLPRRLRGLMRATDLTGVYKGWTALSDEELAPHKQRFFDNFNQLRRLWIFRGYPSIRAWR